MRIFTNINPADVVLPTSEGYRYETILIFLPSVQVQNMLDFSWCNLFSELRPHPNCHSNLNGCLAPGVSIFFFFQEFDLFSEKIFNSLVSQRLKKTSHINTNHMYLMLLIK